MHRLRRGSKRLVVPLLGLVVGVAYTAGATRYPAGTLVSPGPGLFPLLAGLTIALGAAIALITEARAPSTMPEPLAPARARVPILVVALTAYAIVLQGVGFLVASATLCAVVLVILGRRGPWGAIAIAVALSAGAWVTFRILGVPLPPDPFGLQGP